MEPTLGTTVCFICFEMTKKEIFVPSDGQAKIFSNCNRYLHSTIIKDTLQYIQLNNKNQVSLCKSCFDSALELTQLSEQLITIQKDISDLTIAFSMTVFHRRSQVYSIGQSENSSSVIEFNESCLPPNIFSMKNVDRNFHQSKINPEMDSDNLRNHIDADATNVKSDIQFANLSGNPRLTIANDAAEIQFNNENINKHSGQLTIQQNFVCASEMRIVHSSNESESKRCADPKNGVKLTMSDLLKSVKMPEIILERLKTVGNQFGASVVKSSQTKREPRQKIIDEALCNNDDASSVHSCAPETEEDGNIIKCFYCEKAFALEWQRDLHHKTHAVDEPYKFSSSEEKLSYQSNQKIYERTDTGEQTFKNEYQKLQTGEKPYKCLHCEKTFSTLRAKNKCERLHKEQIGDYLGDGNILNSLLFKCSFCNKNFTRPDHLKSHERTHTGEKPFECSLCKKKFSRSDNLHRHKRLHTGEKPYKCLYCEKRFRQCTNKNIHETSHREQIPTPVGLFGNQNDNSLVDGNIQSSLPFKCSFCNKSFKSSYQLKSHERTHTGEKPFECSFCKKKFSYSYNLKLHKRTHTGEKPFECSFCGKRFATKREFEVHERLHTGEKPYKCLYCEKRFRGDTSRYIHQKSHREQISSLISKSCNENSNSLTHLKHLQEMHPTFGHGQDTTIPEKIEDREDENAEENLIVGI